MENKKAIVFDMDGVIFDSEVLVRRCWKETAMEYNVDDMEKVFLECVGVSLDGAKKIFYKYYGQDFPYYEFREKSRKKFFAIVEKETLPVKKGVRELLKFLKAENYIIGIASSNRIKIIKKEITEANLMPYFNTIIGGDLVEKSKPEPDIYLLACEEMGVDPRYTYVIEDSYNGIKSAHSANMKAIMVPDILEPNAEMKVLSYKICNDLLEVLDDFKCKKL